LCVETPGAFIVRHFASSAYFTKPNGESIISPLASNLFASILEFYVRVNRRKLKNHKEFSRVFATVILLDHLQGQSYLLDKFAIRNATS